MAHAFRSINARATGSGNPQTASVTVLAADTVVAVLLKTVGGTDRAGGALTLGPHTLTQANSTQKAAASPEGSCELWYVCDPMPGTWTLTIPNTGSATLYWTVVAGQAQEGMISALDGANGSNGTSTNPTAGAITVSKDGAIGFSVSFSGATDYDPATPSHTGFETGTGTPLGTFDDGANGMGQQYGLVAAGSVTFGWTFGTSDDWGCVAAIFKEVAGPTLPVNYQFVKVGSGMSCSEKIR